MTKHAILSPSGFKALMLCPAKPAMERGLPDNENEYSKEGTLAHAIGAAWLEGKETEGADPEMAGYVHTYVQLVRDYQGDGDLFVEQALPIGHITGEEDAEGTADAVILREDELIVIDLKYGKGVEVDAFENPQLMLYALGAIEKFGMVYDFVRVRMVICQPRVSSAPSEFTMPVAALVRWAKMVATPCAEVAMHYIKTAADGLSPADGCKPHPDACRFCKAKGDCDALANHVERSLEAEFTDLTTADKIEQEQIIERLVQVPVEQLGAKMDAVELVEMWCKAVRGRVESALLAGTPVAGYKLVQGKKGARAWTDADEAEKVMKSMRLKREEMYDLSLISPTSAEKILKATPKRWNRVLPLIKQSEGKPSVAPVSDKRPALEIKPVESEFTAIETAEDLL